MIYRAIRKLKAVLYHAIVEPDIKRSFAECGKDSHIDSGGDFFPLSNIHVGNHASIGVNARFWTTRAKIYIEDYALFGPGVTIITGDHRKDIGTFYKESFLRRSARTAYSNHRRR